MKSKTHKLDLQPCPAPGEGVHSWTLGAANRCRNRGLSPAAATAAILKAITRAPGAGEIEAAVAKAYSQKRLAYTSTPRAIHAPAILKPVPLGKVSFDAGTLKGIAGDIADLNLRHVLWEKSPICPTTVGPVDFLSALYQPGETVLVFDKMETKYPAATVKITPPPMEQELPEWILQGGRHGLGIWCLSNPVTGQWHVNQDEIDPHTGEPSRSIRAWPCVTEFRHMVLETDVAKTADWLAFLMALPAKIAAIYTSGGRSVHALARIGAKTKEEFDEFVQPLKRPLKRLGADTACLTAVRLTRLPGCQRPEKNGFQKLLFLNGDPAEQPINDLPIVRSRVEYSANLKQQRGQTEN